ncbi:oxaloacetate decarboxylase subunit alpha [Desulfosarcina widdelii]|uniref:Oxaloacetate decarboxylase subunit alpha n=1 Tax=Desulfosarcina widdelii TaxID=947919 RepID=A0A5K7ZDV2_9BACT|nr:biotin attachment protein [Desulfosarcina widdelii]BBO78369.1 oxaloacetate decarboxylase subunit alpha [Desulfosarcina widdelii]
MKKIRFMDTSLRDGFQSVFGARALTDDFIPAVEAGVHAGIKHMEAGGGARFQALFMYCGESAFDMMDRFRAAAGPETHLQTLARGINVVALSAQPKDMIDLHAKMFKKHGMTHIRNFDALNDIRNLIYSGQCITNAGLHHQVVISMMELPPGCSGAHDAEFYIKTLRKILDSGLPFDSICFKDASGTSNPKKFYDTIKAARAIVGEDTILWAHTHETAGVGITQYKAAIEAGCDGVDLARSPLSGGTCQPDILSLWHALKDTDYTLDIDVSKIMSANRVLQDCLQDYFFPPESQKVSSEVILSPMPGGALTANTMMMRDTGTLDLYPDVIEAMSECVARGGFGTSVTPVSQFYFQQAYANVTQGAWKKITDGYGKMVLGYFGRTPVAPDPEIVRLAEEQMGKPVFKGDPLDVIEPGIPKARQILEKEGLPLTDENIFIVGALATPGGNKGLDFLKGKKPINVRKIGTETEVPAQNQASAVAPAAANEPADYTVTVDGKAYRVTVEPTTGEVKTVSPAPSAKPDNAVEVKVKLQGIVSEIYVAVGDRVNRGDTLVLLEAMKMETPVVAPCDGNVASIEVAKDDVVKPNQLVATIA